MNTKTWLGFNGTCLLAGCLILLASCTDSPTDPADPLGGAVTTSGQSGPGGSQGNKGEPPRFIIQVVANQNPHTVAAEHGIETEYVYTHAVKGFAGAISDAARAGLLKDARVVSVEKDVEIVHQHGGTTQLSPPWGLDRIDQRQSFLNGAYEIERTGSGVTAYIMDSGIRYSHVEFGGRARAGFDAFDGDGSDCYGHGTHVAGTVGGATYGVAKGVDLVSVKVLNCGGFGTGAGLLAGLEWIVANRDGPSVVNISLAFAAGKGGNSWMDQAIKNVIGTGVTVVAAAANYSTDACDYLPARVKEAITVGSTGRSDQRSSFSNWGQCVDWFAPGEQIISASFDSDAGRTSKSGTSMAAPHTTGAVALFLEANPDASPGEVAETLFDRATKSVVGNALSRNDHLLFSLGNGAGSQVNHAPVAFFSFSCMGLECHFTDGSSDPDGSVVAWAWTFGTEGTSILKDPVFTFSDAGTYQVSLTVTDNQGETAVTTQDLTVSKTDLPNQPPTAGFSFTCESLECHFTDQSSDPDGVVTSWLWSIGSSASSTQSTVTHVFPEVGTYSVSVTVTDDDGASASSTQDVTVSVQDPADGILLTAMGIKERGAHQVQLSWLGANGSAVELFRNGDLVGSIPNTGWYLDEYVGRGQASYVYKLCEEESRRCSPEVEVVF